MFFQRCGRTVRREMAGAAAGEAEVLAFSPDKKIFAIINEQPIPNVVFIYLMA
jgi:hypothetical protein